MSKKDMWELSPFFGMSKNAVSSIRPGWSEGTYRIGLEKLNDFENIGFVPPMGYCVVDADDEESIKLIDNLLHLLNMDGKVFSYPTTRGRHYVFKKPSGKYFDEIASQNGETVFRVDDQTKSKIDIKAGGFNYTREKVSNGFVCVKKKGNWRVEPQAIMDAFNEDTPECPLVLLTSKKKIHFYLTEYRGGNRDTYMFEHVVKFRLAEWTKEQFIKFCVEIKLITPDKESVAQTVEWASAKWDSSVAMGKPEEIVQESILPDAWDDFVEVAKVVLNKDEPKEEEPKPKKKTKKEKKEEKEKFVNDRRLKTDGVPLVVSDGDVSKFLSWSKTDDNYPRATGIKSYRGLASAIIEDCKLQYSEEDNQIWGKEYGEDSNFQVINNLDLLVRRWCVEKIGNAKPGVMTELKGYLMGAIPTKKFEENPFLVAFKNKIINVRTRKEHTLDDDVMMQNTIPHRLIAKEEFETTHKEAFEFLNKTMMFWCDNDKMLVKQLYERIGLSMTRYMGHEKAYFIFGDANNGKSEFLNLWIRALGKNNVSHEDLKELSNDPFSSSVLYGKIANINLDISSEVINDTSLFKKIISGDRLSASFKGQNKFSFTPYATQIFGANNIPYAKEMGQSDGVNRRLEIIPFLNHIENLSENDKIEFKENIADEKVTECFIYKAIEAVKGAFKKSFYTSRVSHKNLDDAKRKFNHLYDFVEESGVKDDEPIIKAFARYEEWARPYKHTTFGLREFVDKYINVANSLGEKLQKEVWIKGRTSERHRFINKKVHEEQLEHE